MDRMHFTRAASMLDNNVGLVGILFARYLSSAQFGTDMLTSVIRLGELTLVHNVRPVWAASTATDHLAQRVFYHLTESLVLAALLQSRTPFLRDAAVLHLLFPRVQEVRFARCWLTRLLHAGGRLFIPLALRQLVGRWFHPLSFPAPDPSRPLGGLPEPHQHGLRFFAHHYAHDIPYAVAAGGLVPDVTAALLAQWRWARRFLDARHKRTTPWRLLKPYAAALARAGTAAALSFTARAAGAWIGRRVWRGADGAGVFWGERLALWAVLPAVRAAAGGAASALRREMERRHPSTEEDEREDRREQEEEAGGANRYTDTARDGMATGETGETGGGGSYYAVLGVQAEASTEEIRRAYRQLALRNHPDRAAHDPAAQQEARERMTAINAAYETLSSDTRRRQYDARSTVGEMPGFLKKMDQLSTVGVAMVGVVGIAGCTITMATIFYTSYMLMFYECTQPGTGLIYYFDR